MQAASHLLSFLLILLYLSGWTNALCNLENSTVMRCDDLEDVKYIETYDLEILKTSTTEDVLIPGLFDNLTSLRHLDLSGGSLKKIETGNFRILSNLKSLNLGENHIEYLELASLEGLTHLRSLNLRRNAIRQLPPALARLKNLRYLDIHGNPLECNCATLKVRDLIMQRDVTVSKKVVCAGPGNMKGTSLMKPSAVIICSFEQQDREMQNDQADEGSGTEMGSGNDILNEFFDRGDEDEYTEVNNGSSEKPKEPEVETPFPTSVHFTTGSSVVESTSSLKETTEAVEETTSVTTNSLQSTTDDEEIFFDFEEKIHTTTEISQKKKDFKDSLFYPSFGDGDEGSGEGSGAGILAFFDEEKTVKTNTNDNSVITVSDIWSILFGSTPTTTQPTTETKDPDFEEEQFIDVSPTVLATEETIVPKKSDPVESTDTGRLTTEKMTTLDGAEVLHSAGSNDKSKSSSVKAEVDSLSGEQAEVSPAKQSKKGMGSYVVLAILLAVVATLIGIAAYRGEICRKKKKRSDVENGTELTDMQRSLLPDTGNSTQPKIASNGNAESVPLVEDTPNSDGTKIDKIHDDDYQTQEAPRSLNGTVDHPDPVKPPRKMTNPQEDQKSEDRPRVDVNSLRENFLAGRTSPAQPSESSITTNNGPMTHVSEPNGPPLSPEAQRVKITLQENPDSVPKTPILITRTMAGENLVKTS